MDLKVLWLKAKTRGLTLPNILSYLSLKIMEKGGLALGTLSLRVKAKLLGVKLGQKVLAHGPVGLARFPGGSIEIGHYVKIISTWRRATAQTLYAPTRFRVFGPGAKIIIGDNCELSGASITARSTCIRLGKGCLLGPNCVITDSDFHKPWPCEERAMSPGIERDQGVNLEDYVWVGMQSLILKGVHIGRGSIIGAGSVVTHDIPSNSIAAGNPAKVIRTISEHNDL
ncbi:MAG: acyltransferase [Desulfovibrionaceae bacterium]|nr:acyltransferase [Desulfovibrionaceae bacterium]